MFKYYHYFLLSINNKYVFYFYLESLASSQNVHNSNSMANHSEDNVIPEIQHQMLPVHTTQNVTTQSASHVKVSVPSTTEKESDEGTCKLFHFHL